MHKINFNNEEIDELMYTPKSVFDVKAAGFLGASHVCRVCAYMNPSDCNDVYVEVAISHGGWIVMHDIEVTLRCLEHIGVFPNVREAERVMVEEGVTALAQQLGYKVEIRDTWVRLMLNYDNLPEALTKLRSDLPVLKKAVFDANEKAKSYAIQRGK